MKFNKGTNAKAEATLTMLKCVYEPIGPPRLACTSKAMPQRKATKTGAATKGSTVYDADLTREYRLEQRARGKRKGAYEENDRCATAEAFDASEEAYDADAFDASEEAYDAACDEATKAAETEAEEAPRGGLRGGQ